MQPSLEAQVPTTMQPPLEDQVPTTEMVETDIPTSQVVGQTNTQLPAAPTNVQTVAALNTQTNCGQIATGAVVVEDGFNEYQIASKRPKKTSNVWEHFNQLATKDKNTVKAACKFLDLYLAEPTRELTEDLDILDFWSKSSMRYPELAKMACDLLSIPVSTVASESAFSTGGKIITNAQSSLKSKTIQAIVCLRDWIKATDEQTITMDNDDSSTDDGFDMDEGEDCGLTDLF